MPVSIASTARRRVDLEGVLVASSMSTSLVIVGRRQRRRRGGGAALLSSSSTRPSRSPGLALPDVHSRCMCCDCTGLEPICAAADQRPARSGFLRIRLDQHFCGSGSISIFADRGWIGLAFTCRSRRHSTTNSTGPDFSPYHLGSLCCVECFRSNSDAYCSRAGSGRTSTCSTTSFAIHGTVTELDLQMRIRLFP